MVVFQRRGQRSVSSFRSRLSSPPRFHTLRFTLPLSDIVQSRVPLKRFRISFIPCNVRKANLTGKETVARIQDRMIRAAKLDAQLYEEVEADRGAMREAMTVVVLSAVAAGIGNLANGGLLGIISGTIGALVGWYIWAFLTYFIGTRLLPEPDTKADHGELLRTIGFSSAPGLIRVFGIIPGLTTFVFAVAGGWMLVAMVIAVRQALDYKSTWRAIGVCMIGFVVQAFVLMIAISIFGSP